jgi:hypothetical protein
VHIYTMKVGEFFHCYNVVEEDKEEDEDPRNVKIPKTEGECIVEGPQLELFVYAKPLRIHKVNIGVEDKPKFVKIIHYCNDEIMEKIVDLLRKYQDLFPATFSEMKGIVGELGEMNIPLKVDDKSMK